MQVALSILAALASKGETNQHAIILAMGRITEQYEPALQSKGGWQPAHWPVLCRFETYFKRLSELDASTCAPLHVALFTLLNHLNDAAGVKVRRCRYGQHK